MASPPAAASAAEDAAVGALIGQSPQRAVPLWRAAVIVAVFSLHNAWNCWVFLNFTNFDPPKKMFNATEADIGFITTMGWLGILSSVPIVTVCTWHRTLLWVAGVLNVLPPVVRYYAGVHGNYALVVGTNFAQGAAFGIIGAWPPMLATMLAPERHRTAVTALTSLSNYVGGAAGVVFMPAVATSQAALKQIFMVQCYVSVVLFLLMFSWAWLPPFQQESTHTLSQVIRIELAECFKADRFMLISTFGIAVGLSLCLQGMMQFILSGVGFSDIFSGVVAGVYQLTAALVGIRLSTGIQSTDTLPLVIKRLHMLAGGSWVCFVVLCVTCEAYAGSVVYFYIPVAIAAMTLGASLMGMLPFLLQQAVVTADVASENVVSGLLYLVAMAVAATTTQVVSVIGAMGGIWVVGGLLFAELVLFYGPVRRSYTRLKSDQDDEEHSKLQDSSLS